MVSIVVPHYDLPVSYHEVDISKCWNARRDPRTDRQFVSPEACIQKCYDCECSCG